MKTNNWDYIPNFDLCQGKNEVSNFEVVAGTLTKGLTYWKVLSDNNILNLLIKDNCMRYKFSITNGTFLRKKELRYRAESKT